MQVHIDGPIRDTTKLKRCGLSNSHMKHPMGGASFSNLVICNRIFVPTTHRESNVIIEPGTTLIPNHSDRGTAK